jgi:hypothetical protein
MIEARADIELGEAIQPAATAHARIYRGDLTTILVAALSLAGCIIATTLVAMLISRFEPRLNMISSLLWIFGAFIGLALALRIYARRHIRGFLGRLKQMGSPECFPTRFTFDEKGISVENERLSHRITWPAVHFVILAKQHWLVQVDTITIAIPRRAFSNPASEQGFLDLAAEQMRPEARRRSVLANQ